MYYFKFFTHIYFPFLLLKIIIFIFIGSFSGFFSTLNDYIYQVSAPYLPCPNQKHKSFVLVDASQADFKKISQVTHQIETFSPRLIIVDIAHQDTIFNQKNIDYITNKETNLIFTLPYFMKKSISGEIDLNKIT